MLGVGCQRCRLHFLRNVLAEVPERITEVITAAIRTVFAQADAAHVNEQFDTIATTLGLQLPKVEQMMRGARDDVLAFATFPAAHWKKVWSTNPLERLNQEVNRRTDIVGAFLNPAALLRLAGAVLVEAHDERAISERRYVRTHHRTTDFDRQQAGSRTSTAHGIITMLTRTEIHHTH